MHPYPKIDDDATKFAHKIVTHFEVKYFIAKDWSSLAQAGLPAWLWSFIRLYYHLILKDVFQLKRSNQR